MVDGLREQLTNRKAVALYVETYTAECRRLAIEATNIEGSGMVRLVGTSPATSEASPQPSR
ncbi:hypothetical protein [Mesorhizobium sp. B2-8-9]|uniref:hypothetical protein n=1 Tax=Mesorhizobium sp. B2-8-9 TaxID=2589899 RepID=UPI0015E40D41|nr:hypothetical protein [Mesorhizobium sp. B2-8-9]